MNNKIKLLKEKSIRNNILTTYQLSQNYKYGFFVDSDTDEAAAYERKTKKQMQDARLVIDSIDISGFGGTLNTRLHFSPKVTLLVGCNGAGKSNILKAVAKSTHWLSSRIRTAEGKGSVIDQDEINNSEDISSASLKAKFSLNKNTSFNFLLTKTKDATRAKHLKSNLKDITTVGEIYRLCNESDASLPLFGYYPVGRSFELKYKSLEDDKRNRKAWKKIDAYNSAFSNSINTNSIMDWFEFVDDTQNIEENLEIKAIEGEILAMKKVISSIDDMTTVDFIEDRITELKAMLDTKKGELPEQVRATSHAINIVKNAIYTFIPQISNLRLVRVPELDVLVDKSNVTLRLRQLSQGEQSLFALVSDIAKRLALLNPGLDNPLTGNGIVIIDEIDLHLHPEWEQSILPKLLTTFPNIQFIISTHSALTAASVSSENIIIVNNGDCMPAPKGIKGANFEKTLNRIFKIESRYKDNDIVIKLNRYLDLVYSNNWDTKEAKELKKLLNDNFDGDDKDLQKAQIYIENKIWEQGL